MVMSERKKHIRMRRRPPEDRQAVGRRRAVPQPFPVSVEGNSGKQLANPLDQHPQRAGVGWCVETAEFDDAGDPNRNDGQANCNQTRARAAMALAGWLASDPTRSDDTDFLLLGDFNAYLEEDPIRALTAAGLENLLETDGAIPYSYLYDGQAGALDYAFASASLAERVAAATVWHINADEAPLHDYNLEHGRNPAIFDVDNPYRSSDHDPVVVDLELDGHIAGPSSQTEP